MISWSDLYSVLCAVVPLYATMFLAYGSVKHMKIFTPGQCAGINRFVAIFAIPLLSFEFISKINPYKMDLPFVAADFVSKLLILAGLSLWANLDWLITLFSLSTLPNTLVIGIPLLKSMYGNDREGLMLQTLVLQCIIWNSLLLFLFEYRAARLTVVNQIKEAEQINVANTSGTVDGEEDVIRVVVMSRPDVLEPDNVHINWSHRVAPAANSRQQQQQQQQLDDDGFGKQSKLEEEKEREVGVKREEAANPRVTSVMMKSVLGMVWYKLIRNPNSYASILGLGWALVSWR